jgi:hypothetical protein
VLDNVKIVIIFKINFKGDYMQTFLPYSEYDKTAACLDRLRLGKQRVEVLQILKALTYGSGWKNHPITKMWKGYELSLIKYGIAICDEWISRGYKDICKDKIKLFYNYLGEQEVKPEWLGNEELHNSHKSNLLRKFPEHYGQFGWKVSNDLPYVWKI